MAQHAPYPTDSVVDPFGGSEPPRIANRIIDYRRIQPWENYFLASAICSVAVAVGADEEQLKTLGNEKGNSGLHFFSAITGDMFTVLYSTEEFCDSGLTNAFFVPQVVKKAYLAFGRDCLYLSNAQIKKDFRAVVNAIKASVDRGIPVLAWGMGNVTIGDWHGDMPEGCLIGGYDGDLLYANLYPGPGRMEVDEDGYYAVPDGLNGVLGLFFVGEPNEKIDLQVIYEQSIADIPGFLTAPPADSYVFGKVALEEWADTLLDESRYVGKNDDELNEICWQVHCAPFCNICTSAAVIYIRAAAEVYNIDIAKRLLPLYEKFTRLRQDIWMLHGDFFPPMDKFKTREFRAEIAKMLREMGSVCDEILMAFEEDK